MVSIIIATYRTRILPFSISLCFFFTITLPFSLFFFFFCSNIQHFFTIPYYSHIKWTAFSQILAHHDSILLRNITRVFRIIKMCYERKKKISFISDISLDDFRLCNLFDIFLSDNSDTPSKNPWRNDHISIYTYTSICI